MPPEDDASVERVKDQPAESHSDAGIAGLARSGQEKPQDLKDKEAAHAELRKIKGTPSSKDLPQMDWVFTKEGMLVIQTPNKLITRKVGKDDPVMAREMAESVPGERPAEKNDQKLESPKQVAGDNGARDKSQADKLVEKFKNFTPEQQRQLREDLAAIDKLPEEQRKRIYQSLDTIARNDEHPDQRIRLTGAQARELVSSLAHQIAHPESIRQGDRQTSTVACAEQALARVHPEVYADMVAKLATDGLYTTADGKRVKAQGVEDGKLDAKSDDEEHR